MIVVGECGVEVVLVEVDGGEEEDAGAGGDEGVAEDDVPVSEVVEKTPVVPLFSFYQKIIKLHRRSWSEPDYLAGSVGHIYQVSDHK